MFSFSLCWTQNCYFARYLTALVFADEAAAALHQAGAISVIKSIPDPTEDQEITKYQSNLLKKFQDLRYN